MTAMKRIVFTIIFSGICQILSAQCKPDKVPPLLVPKGNIQVALGGEKCVATVKPGQFLAALSDNCTPQAGIRLGIRRAGTGWGFPVAGQPLRLTAADMGAPVVVELWAADGAGNKSQVYSSVSVANPAGCVFQLLPDTVCVLYGENGLEDLIWHLETTWPPPPSNTFEIDYCVNLHAALLSDTLSGYRYKITPSKDNDPLNGVSMFDAILILKHILDFELLNNPYKILAADIDRNGAVTVNDIIELRKLILGIYTELPNNTSWRFVPSDFEFLFPENPFYSAVPESVSFDISRKTPLPDMVGIKVGDVNANALTNNLTGTATDRSPAVLRLPDQYLSSDADFSIPVYLDAPERPDGFQCAFSFDPSLVDITALRPAGVPDFSADNYFQSGPGLITVAWINFGGAMPAPDVPAFFLEGRALREVTLQQALSLHAGRLSPEFYGGSSTAPASLTLEFLPLPLPAEPRVGIAFPNPGNDAVQIPVELPRMSDVTLEINTPDGQILYSRQTGLDAGRQSLTIPGFALGRYTGILMYRIRVDGALYQGKLLRF